MSRQTLYRDLDDVVLDFTKTYKEVGTYLWHNRKEFGITKENFEGAVDTYLLTNYYKVKVNKDFHTVIPLLRSKYRVVFISMYVSEGELAYKKHLAKVYADDGIFLNVAEYENKSATNMLEGIFIDDTLEMLTSSNAKRRILFCNVKDYLLKKVPSDVEKIYSWVQLMGRLNLL